MAEITPSDVMMMTKHHNSHGQSATAIGLAAGLGGGALLLAIGLGWGINKASEARAKAAEQAVAGNKDALNLVSQFALSERTARETWQNAQTPTVKQYVDVQSQATSNPNVSASALADAYAYALAQQNNSGLNSAVGNCGFLRVQRYSAPQPCGCDTCSGN